MPTRLYIWERRDNGDRNIMANAALNICRECRKTDGIRSAKYYWGGTEKIVTLVEGEASALNAPFAGGNTALLAKLSFDLADQAKLIEDMRLADAKAGEETYKTAGRT